MNRAQRQFIAFMIMQALVIPVALAMFFVNPKLMPVVSTLGEMLVVFGWLAYVVLFDSRKRWPKTNAAQRLTNVMTFTR